MLRPEEECAVCEGGRGADYGAGDGGGAPVVGSRGEEVVGYRNEPYRGRCECRSTDILARDIWW